MSVVVGLQGVWGDGVWHVIGGAPVSGGGGAGVRWG